MAKLIRSLSARDRSTKQRAWDRFVYKSRRRKLAEIEAAEACEWLRAAGFPQYAQMFEDFQFPIDIHSVAKDHDFLDRDSIQSLFRRLNILNKCASLKIETTAKRTGEESDEDDQCALSRKWKFQRSSRRWSRRLNPLETYNQESKSDSFGSGERREKEFNESMQIDPTVSTVSSLHNLTREQKLCQISGPDVDYNAVKGNNVKTGSLKMPSQKSRGPAPREAIIEISSPILVEKTTHKEFPTNTHERMKGAKSLLKRLDSLKGKKYSSLKKRPSLNTKDGISISGPIVTSSSNLQEKIELYNCVDLNTAQENEREKQLTSPSVTRRAKSESLSSNKSKRGGMIFNQDQSIEGIIHSSETSDLESPLTTPQQSPTKVTRTRSVVRSCDEDDEVFSSQTFPRLLSNGYIQTGTGGRINTRTGSFNFGSDSCHDNVHVPRASPNKRRRNSDDKGAYNRGSIYDNVPATLHASLDRMPFTDGSLDDLEEQLRREICNLSNLDHCRSSSVPAMSELESSFVSAEDPFRLHRNMSSTSMSSAEIESEKQDILNNINQLLMTDNFNDEHIVFEAKDSTKEKSDSVSQKSYDTWQEEDSEIDMDDISAISAEVEKLLNGINENLNQINQLEESNSVHDNYSGTDDLSVTSPIPSPTHTTPEMEPKKGHVVSDMDGGLSATSSCQDTSEVDTAGSTEDIHGIMQIRERRDSGVGSSLSRSMRRPRIRWHSFSKSHRPSLNSRPFQIHNLSAGQIMVLRKLALLKLTAMMERHSVSNRSWSGWIKVMPRFMRRPKMPDYKDKNVFGVPLHVTLQRTGQPLPQTILFAMRYLRNTAPDAVGIFRKPGVRTRIQQLKKNCEMKPDHADYEGMMAYDVADMLKQYFRELPEPLLTTKLSETFLNIHTSMPKDLRLQALQATIMLMPDENREVLQSLLLFLSDIAQHSDTNQMTAHNLAVCFAPSLFHMSGPRGGTSPQRRRRAQLGKPDQKELSDNIAAHECLALMIREVKKLFVIPEDTMMKCHFSYMELGEPAALNELGRNSGDDNPGYQNYLEECIQGVLKEARDKFKGWVSCPSEEGTELAYKKVGDGHPLRLWKCSAEIEAPPTELLNRLLRDRHSWDEDYAKWRIVEKLDSETEVFQYVRNSMAPHPSRDYCVVRKWKTDLPRGACVLVSTSVEHPDAALIGGIRGTVLASRYLIEPCGAGKSRLTYICRIDSRGRSVEWYNKAFGQMSANMIGRLRDSFKHSSAEGPETKV
ncbi:rho GTPase-activating protein 7-like isoform X2 [Ptychodera flava]|uniref:rho GTPase-activating protein 7-like isoform X2 n=1 Tax=Ptychodera flava TaxID=63121 RepID=UPI00396AA06F